MSRLGIFARTFAGTEPRAVLAAVRSARYDCVQFNFACAGLDAVPREVPEHVARAVVAAAHEVDVRIVALSGTTNLIHPDPTVRADGRARLACVIAAAADCGVGLVTLCTGSRDPQDQWRAHPDNASAAAWRDLLIEMRAALEVAERHDIVLGVEPEAGNVVSSAHLARTLIDELGSARVRVVLDPANLVDGQPVERAQATIADAVNSLAGSIVLAHAKDRNEAGIPVAPGQGIVDFEAFFAALDRVGYAGPVVAHGFSAAEAPAVRTFLKQTAERAGLHS